MCNTDKFTYCESFNFWKKIKKNLNTCDRNQVRTHTWPDINPGFSKKVPEPLIYAMFKGELVKVYALTMFIAPWVGQGQPGFPPPSSAYTDTKY